LSGCNYGGSDSGRIISINYQIGFWSGAGGERNYQEYDMHPFVEEIHHALIVSEVIWR
jgi:hypothetical protein